MHKALPIFITLVIGLFVFVAYFVPHRSLNHLQQRLADWIPVVVAISLILGAISLFQHHILKLIKRHPDRLYSIITLLAMTVTLVLGIGWGVEDGTPFKVIFDSVYKPLTTAMVSLLAFFLASAAYRSFRIRSMEAGLLFGAAVLVMLGRIPLGYSISPILPEVADWILRNPTSSAMRAIQIGAGIGMATLSLKIILGLERTYLS
jgi:hypothetical protein